MAFSKFQWWTIPLWSGKVDDDDENENFSNGSSSSSNPYGYGYDTVKFPLKGTARVTSASSSSAATRKIKKKWQSREERKIDREHDVVVVPSDGVGLSGSESEDSDWSIGWLEPHGPDFLSDDENDDSFAVLVPCYRNDRRRPVEGHNVQILNAIQHLTNEHFTEGKQMMDQWLSSLQTF